MTYDWLSGLPIMPKLSEGAHRPDEGRMCAMEMVAFIERLPHSDHPPCTCPVIAAYVRELNDRMPGDERQRLLPYLPRLVGTASPEHEQLRGRLVARVAGRALAARGLNTRWVARYLSFKKPTRWESAAAARDAADVMSSVALVTDWNAALALLNAMLAIGPSTGWTRDDAIERAAAALATTED